MVLEDDGRQKRFDVRPPFALVVVAALLACGERPVTSEPPPPRCLGGEIIGGFTTGMDGRKCHVRAHETELGNVVADSNWWAVEATAKMTPLDPKPRFFVTNSGTIRSDHVFPAEELKDLRAGAYWIA